MGPILKDAFTHLELNGTLGPLERLLEILRQPLRRRQAQIGGRDVMPILEDVLEHLIEPL
jgi:hypothetical protein